MNIYEFDGLICTDVLINFKGQEKFLKNVVIDTGAVQSIFNSESLIDMGIEPEFLDDLNTTYGIGGKMWFFPRVVDLIKVGGIEFRNIELDFGEIDPGGNLTGLLGLDLLKKIKAVIDVEIPEISLKMDY